MSDRPPGLSFSPLAADDADALGDLFERNQIPEVEGHFDPFPLTRDTAAALITDPGEDRYYAAWLDRRIVAFSMLRGWNEGYEVPSFGIFVDAAHHGQGIGTWLTERTCDEARQLGCTRVRLSVYGSNKHARNLYEAVGFTEASRTEIRSEDRTDERIVMELPLRPKRIPVAEPALVGNELAYVRDCLESTWISSEGAYVNRFESEFARFCSTDHAVACVNGTAALHLALLGAGVGPGDEVIVPTFTYIACANAVRYCGAEPVFVDVDPRTWTIDVDAVSGALTDRTRAILAVHLYGHPADMDALSRLARPHGVAIIEDAAEAHGALYRDRIVGSLGDAAVFSFFGNKILTTGEGGMVVTSDDDMAHRIRILRGQGQEPGTRYWHTVLGFNYRMTNVAAAIGLAQLERVDWHLSRRRAVARWYDEMLAGEDAFSLAPQAPWARSASWMVCGTLNGPGPDRDAVMSALADRGIETRPLFPPLHTQPIYADGSTFPIAEDLAARGFSLPTFATLTRADVERVVHELRAALSTG